MVKEKGIREGINKQEIMKSMTDDDWKKVREMKRLDSLYTENEIARKVFIQSEQLVAQFVSVNSEVNKNVAQLMLLYKERQENLIDLKKGETSRKDMSLKDLEIRNIQIPGMIDQCLLGLRHAFSKIYLYVNRKTIDQKIFYTEDQYNARAKEIQNQLKDTPYNLYE